MDLAIQRFGDWVISNLEITKSPIHLMTTYFLPFFGFSTCATLIRFAVIAFRTVT